MKKLSQIKKLGALAAFVFAMSASGLFAQNLVNEATGVIDNCGTIIMKADGAEIQNENATATDLENTGTIEIEGIHDDAQPVFTGTQPWGQNDTWRIGGIVSYTNATANPNYVIGTGAGNDTYYTNLALSGASVKVFVDEQTHVSGAYDIIGGGDRDYAAGTFVYDGGSSQTITSENGASGGDNIYYSMILTEAGDKYVLSGGNVAVENSIVMDGSLTGALNVNGTMFSYGTFDQDAGAGNIEVDGADGILNLGNGASNFEGNAYITAGGQINTDGTGLLTVDGILTSTSGTFGLSNGNALINGTLTLADQAGVVDVAASRSLTIATGASFNNAADYADRTNMQFDAASNMIYDGSASGVLKTIVSNPYGNLIVRNDPGVEAGDNDMYLAGNFELYDANLDVGEGDFVMLTPTTTPTYDGAVELVGNFVRRYDAGTDTYKFNNDQMITTFTTDADPGGTFIAFNVIPGPGSGANNYDEDTDVDRKITMTYDLEGWYATIRASYLDSETDIGGEWANETPPTTHNQLRFFESEAGETPEKIARTGNPYVRSNDANFYWVELAGIIPDQFDIDDASSTMSGVKSGNDILLRGGPIEIIAINDGRWSNPGTWDEYREPYETDLVRIGDGTNNISVHAGFRRDGVDGLDPDGQIQEGFAAGGDTDRDDGIADRITIADGSGLMFGYLEAGDAGSTADQQNQGTEWKLYEGGLYNQFINSATAALGSVDAQRSTGLLAGARTDADDREGLTIFGNATGDNTTKFTSGSFDNSGLISNCGILQVGN